MTWGKAMKAARLKRGFTQKQLEKKSGVSERNINNYENEKHDPRLFNLTCLADALGISIDEYIGRKSCP